MTLPTSGQISLNDVRAEFGSPSSNVSMSQFYRGGSFVIAVTKNNNIPTSGQISMSNFYGGRNKGAYAQFTAGTASTGGKAPQTFVGIDNANLHGTGNIGSFTSQGLVIGLGGSETSTNLRAWLVAGSRCDMRADNASSGSPVNPALIYNQIFQVNTSTSSYLFDRQWPAIPGTAANGRFFSAFTGMPAGPSHNASTPMVSGTSYVMQMDKGSHI